MTLDMDADFANHGLSIEELEAIAAGWPSWVHSAVNFVKHEATVVEHWVQSPTGQRDIGYIGTGLGILKTVISFF